MNDRLLLVLTLGAALGCGLVGGIFFGFSSFVMKALNRLPPAHGAAAMRSINVAVLNPWFLVPFLGSAALCALLAVASLSGWRDPEDLFRLIGAALYLAGCVGVTAAFNVPRNDALAAVEPGGADEAVRWARYVPSWTAWNTVRTAAALAAAVAFMVSLVVE